MKSAKKLIPPNVTADCRDEPPCEEASYSSEPVNVKSQPTTKKDRINVTATIKKFFICTSSILITSVL